jgi:radical SAM superfamily enzyme YgiQ (UPF0313 family)
MRPLISLVNTNLIRPAVAPIAFDYLADPLRAAGFRVELLDLCLSGEWHADVRAHAQASRPSWWGVTFRNTEDTCAWSGASFVDLAAAIVRELRATRDVPVIVGGVGYSVMPERLLDRLGADYGVVGDGEVALPALLHRLGREAPLDDVAGLVRRVDGVPRRTDAQSTDLDALPRRTRSLVDNRRYFEEGGMAGIETKRGCSRVCTHCVEPGAKGRRVRLRSAADSVDEIETLVEQGVTAFHVNDSEFNLNVGHAIAFCDELRWRGLHDVVRWYAYGMPAPFPDELAAAMKASGCDGMNFGADSADAGMLRRIRRTFRTAHIAAAVETARRHELPHMVELLFGFPGETRASVLTSIHFMQEIDAPLVLASVGVRVFPGTELERIVRAEGSLTANPAVTGATPGNDDLVDPVYYVSTALGPDPVGFVRSCTASDPRFLPVNGDIVNYNANDVLVDAIRNGARGAYWRILSHLVPSEVHADV